MNVLLDSHVFIWLDTDATRLSATVAGYMTNRAYRLLLSTASIWEIAIKIQIGKLKLTDTLENVLAHQTSRNPIEVLPISSAHAIRVGQLPMLHRDPFDRMLVAQAIAENAVLLTDDSLVQQYPVRTDW